MLVETHGDRDGAERGGGGYEAAPATELVATRCAACGRALVDAQSLAAGMGPDCREKYGAPEVLTAADRATANALIYRLALPDHGAEAAPDLLTRLGELGFEQLVERIAGRIVKVRTSWIAERRLLLVQTPKNAAFARVAPTLGLVTEAGLTVASFAKNLHAVHEAIAEHFAGQLIQSPKGFGVCLLYTSDAADE